MSLALIGDLSLALLILGLAVWTIGARGAEGAVVESVKAASDVYSPLTGRVTESNQAIVDEPALVNRAATGDGWFFKLALADASAFDALMDEAAYKAFLETL